ncbi:DDA1 domain-containing protein [Trichostrongylus colubriformis]|uniref:DDA1 domain-containing protein n=1 Tax=Trichostrongylus colubriformis TaxID=6319 RepID=A0AAN8F0R1_TRICO
MGTLGAAPAPSQLGHLEQFSLVSAFPAGDVPTAAVAGVKEMASFLADLPCSNPRHFSKLPDKEIKVQDGTKAVKVAYHVPRRDDEKQITNDKKPYILRFLERQWAVRTEAERESKVDSPKMKKKKKTDFMKKRASSDAPSTSSDPKTRRLS